jgi:hypothetical protein
MAACLEASEYLEATAKAAAEAGGEKVRVPATGRCGPSCGGFIRLREAVVPSSAIYAANRM